ncbi:MAG: hypothetical protein ABL857_04400 [Rickettsiales bacterium]|jgi:hypothetical protein
MKNIVLSFTLVTMLATISNNAMAQAAASAATAARITVGDITDSRTTGQFFKSLKIELKLSGDSVFDAYGILTPDLTVANDDTGRSLLKEKDKNNKSALWNFHPRLNKSDTENVTVELLNPARKATSFTVKGTVSIYNPKLDANAVTAINNLPAIYGKEIKNDELKAAGISLTVLNKETAVTAEKARMEEEKKKAAANPSGIMGSILNMAFGGTGNMDERTLQYLIKDPQNKLLYIEVTGADGTAVSTRSRMHDSRDDVDSYAYSYDKPITADMTLKAYIATPKSMMSVPLSVENTPLP